MKRALFLPLLFATSALGAEITEVADAADGEDVFDANVEVRFEGEWQHALIQRENTQISESGLESDPRNLKVREFEFDRYVFRLVPRIEVGIWKDLAAFVELPVVLQETRNFRYAPGTNAGNSTVARDQSPNAPPTIQGWRQVRGNATDPAVIDGDAFGFPGRGYNAWGWNTAGDGTFTSVRAGFDNPRIGIRWSPVNNLRDPSKPTITLGASYNLGILEFPVQDPDGDPANEQDPGPVARAVHEFHLQVAMSKRVDILDPYFVVDYWGPFAASYAELGYTPRHPRWVHVGDGDRSL